MSNIKLNETPLRTSKNYNINNIKLENINIPKQIGKFKNVSITGANYTNNITTLKLTYGLSQELETQVANKSNQKIKIELKDSENVQIDFKFDKQNLNLIENIEVIAKECTKEATVIIKYESAEEIESYHNGILNVIAKANSKLNIILVNLMNTSSNNFIAIENTLEENANITYWVIDFGGKNSITNYYSNLIGNSSSNNINAIYLGKEEQLFDLNYIAHLKGEKTNVNIEVEGALTDKAKKNFKGTIDFKKGAKKAIRKWNRSMHITIQYSKIKSLTNATMFRRRRRRKPQHKHTEK